MFPPAPPSRTFPANPEKLARHLQPFPGDHVMMTSQENQIDSFDQSLGGRPRHRSRFWPSRYLTDAGIFWLTYAASLVCIAVVVLYNILID